MWLAFVLIVAGIVFPVLVFQGEEIMEMNFNFSRILAVAFFACAVLSISGSADGTASGSTTVRGILQQAVGIGGESTGLAILLDAPLDIEGKSVHQLETKVDDIPVGKLVGKYVEASGTIIHLSGVETGERAVLKVTSLKEVQADGKAESTIGQRSVSLSLEPAQIVWKNIAGQDSGVQPQLTFKVTNNSKSDLVFNLKPDAQFCFLTVDSQTREIVWKYPEGHQSNVMTKVIVGPDKSFSKSIVLPEKAAPTPGTYILVGTICGYKDYQLTTQFVVGTS